MAVVYTSSPSGAIGSGFNRLCLPHDPGFGFPHYDSYSNGANTIGAEYETASAASAHVRSVADKPIPCAVCEAVRGSVLHVTGACCVLLVGCAHTTIILL